jgi:hypothetical protein
MSWIEPTGSSAQCACTRSPVLIPDGRAGVHRVQDRGVGAVEFDQRPGERVLQRLALERFGLPTPGQHRSDAGDRYDLGQRFVGDGVVFGGRYEYPAVGPRTPTMRRSRSAVKKG